MARGDTDLPFICPHCKERFGTGPAVALLSVVNSSGFDENLPCCGKRVTGTISVNAAGYAEIEYDKETV